MAGVAMGCATPVLPTSSPAAATASPNASGPDESSRLADQLQAIALQTSDLAQFGATFDSFDFGPTQLMDALPPPQAAADRFGRIAGWKARYRQSPEVTTGVLVVDSRVDLFPDDASAAADLAAYDARFAAQPSQPGGDTVTKTAPQVGDGATMFTIDPANTAAVRTSTVAWRVGRITGQIVVSGIGGIDTSVVAQALADAVARRMSEELAAT